MKQYPSLYYWNKGIMGETVYAFDKLDGSNIRCEWSKKRGWYKFGSKKCMIDENHEQFGQAVKIFKEKYGDSLAKVFTDDKELRNIRNFIVFSEYVGENSFAGYHDPADKMDMVLFDVNPITKGFIKPKDFVKKFGHLHIPKLIYVGNLNMDLVNDVKQGKYPVKEGVIAKGVTQKDHIWMVKIKTNSWLDRLKGKFGEEGLKEELNNDLTLI